MLELTGRKLADSCSAVQSIAESGPCSAGSYPLVVSGCVVTQRDIERFLARIRRNEQTGCLEWHGATVDGYGRFGVKVAKQKTYSLQTHKLAYAIANGGDPYPLCVLHRIEPRPEAAE